MERIKAPKIRSLLQIHMDRLEVRVTGGEAFFSDLTLDGGFKVIMVNHYKDPVMNQSVFNGMSQLGDGFKDFLFSPRSLGK